MFRGATSQVQFQRVNEARQTSDLTDVVLKCQPHNLTVVESFTFSECDELKGGAVLVQTGGRPVVEKVGFQ